MQIFITEIDFIPLFFRIYFKNLLIIHNVLFLNTT